VGVRMQVEAKDITYTVVEDLTSIFEVLVEGSVVDDVTGGAPGSAVQLDADRDGVFLKALENGDYCLAGELERVLPLHGTTTHSFEVTIGARGYLPQTITVTVLAAAALPVQLPEVRLRPFPVRVQGRVVQSSTNRDAAAAAVVRVGNVGAQGRLALRTPLHADHGATTPVQRRTAARAGVVRRLARDATGGTDVLALTGPAVAGTPVIGFVPQQRLEFVPVATVGPGPGEVTLTQPLTRSYPADTEVEEFTFATPAGAPGRRLTRDALAGDGLLLLDGVVGPATTVVQVGDAGSGPIEFHAVGARADGDGYYALEGIGGVTGIALRARPTPTGPPGPAAPWTIDYGRSSNLVNLKLAP
jgi:hypothetical protein